MVEIIEDRIIFYRGYAVRLIKVSFSGLTTKWGFGDREYYNAYTCFLPNLNFDNGNITYHQGDIYGVDTAHAFNEDMTIEQKEADALRQIGEIIDEFEEVHKCVEVLISNKDGYFLVESGIFIPINEIETFIYQLCFTNGSNDDKIKSRRVEK